MSRGHQDPATGAPPLGGAIATPHHLSTSAGVRALRSGGNALDAALAAAVSLTVTLPDNCALGGDLIALMRRPDGEVLSINSSGPAAVATSREELSRATPEMPRFGPDTVTVPGVLRGWEALARNGAALAWHQHFDRAITQAREGVPASPSIAEALEREATRLRADPGMSRIFYPGGRAMRAGETFAQPQLAQTLRKLADKGSDHFYAGQLGAEWLKSMQAAGSKLTGDDLARYQPELTEPLAMSFAGLEVLTSPPNSQGLLLLATLRSLEAREPLPDPLGAGAGAVARACSGASDIRDRYLADPRFRPLDVEAILSGRDAAEAGHGAPLRRPRGDTVAVVAADSDGRAVSLIQSVFDSFGAGILDPRTGIVAHNRGSFFSLDPASPNVIEPGKRPAHTLAPALALCDGELWAVLGTMGGLAQTQILTQVLLHLRSGLDAEQAVSRPRWTIGGIEAGGDEAAIEAERGVPAAVRDTLVQDGWHLEELPERTFAVGEAQAITCGPSGRLAAASDPRSEGSSFAGPCR